MAQGIYKSGQKINLTYQAVGALSNAIPVSKVYNSANASDAAKITVLNSGLLANEKVGGRYLGYFTPDTTGRWTICIQDKNGDGLVSKTYEVGGQNLDSIGSAFLVQQSAINAATASDLLLLQSVLHDGEASALLVLQSAINTATASDALLRQSAVVSSVKSAQLLMQSAINAATASDLLLLQSVLHDGEASALLVLQSAVISSIKVETDGIGSPAMVS